MLTFTIRCLRTPLFLSEKQRSCRRISAAQSPEHSHGGTPFCLVATPVTAPCFSKSLPPATALHGKLAGTAMTLAQGSSRGTEPGKERRARGKPSLKQTFSGGLFDRCLVVRRRLRTLLRSSRRAEPC